MNVPNILTVSRFLLIPVFLLVFFNGYEIHAYGILLLAGITDVIDGYLARKHHLVTELGSMLDPLADKLMMITVIISLLVAGEIPWLVAAIFFFRDASMIIGSAFFHFRGKKTVPANALGKMTTFMYYLAVLLITFDLPYNVEFFTFVVAFSFLTSIVYMFQFKKIND
ncbi:CDP-alcohol phosphatidyltransferase family protein [Tepidibacillus infernus]|uniref:Phosphatidylglycerophosphate synthase n=1 Tax=Tepidibacillus decaturensis TaxID=1413211 RepID=A0A135L6I5_9BACI|nr:MULTISPECIES: CDP-alcohol phosphatidyltransferase family protein [Tepidibacillus]KXG44621.1 CDP-diacylglycerol--glycerol-3-phosphate 3-phosphatidyltransferase [Tepidibacillus decaturensis]GBF11851.1 putative CDP-diacylglycerol--glycerol-3-phosphate 3-phosphatidyl-transferase 2 [Tepidibacillus sp. HK-1]